jgi:AcrR family transcriptional regulator
MARSSVDQTAATRRRLIEATLEILSQEGSSALTTGRVAECAGIVQSGFYKHFPNMDACLTEALSPIQAAVRDDIATRRRAWFASEPEGSSSAAGARHYAENLAFVVEHPTLSEIAVRRRFETGPVGELMRSFADGLVEDLVDDLLPRHPKRRGRTARAECETAARVILGAVYAAIECLLEGRAERADLGRLLDAMAGAATHIVLRS